MSTAERTSRCDVKSLSVSALSVCRRSQCVTAGRGQEEVDQVMAQYAALQALRPDHAYSPPNPPTPSTPSCFCGVLLALSMAKSACAACRKRVCSMRSVEWRVRLLSVRERQAGVQGAGVVSDVVSAWVRGCGGLCGRAAAARGS
eukprot:884216-Rhodomonas_salina.4